MKTASHAGYSGPGRIVISRGAPRSPVGGYRMYRSLAPTREMMSMDYYQYRTLFFRDILGPLSPSKVWDDLHALANGSEPILQCFERPPFNARNWCHRRMVAEWFADALGQQVPEMGYSGPDFLGA